MKHWQETAAILERIAAWPEGAAPCALATVVGISGSSYRRPGAKLLVVPGGEAVGGISGGCLEADVREVAAQVVRRGEARLRRYDTADGEGVWGLGLGCDGTVDVLVQPVDDRLRAQVVPRALALVRAARPFVLATVARGPGSGATALWDGRGEAPPPIGDATLDAALAAELPGLLAQGAHRRLALGSREVFAEGLLPPPPLLVFGAGDDARPLVRLAAEVGFAVTVVDHRPAYLTPQRFPPPARLLLRGPEEGLDDLGPGEAQHAVVLTHSLARDRDWTAALLRRPLAYLGLLGSRKRARDVLGAVPAGAAARVFAPVGLDLGADGPEQVAVSVVAELLAVRAGRSPAHLRAREAPIHGA